MPAQFDLTVISNFRITPHMRRVALGGSDLSSFPKDQASGYVKVSLQDENRKEVRRSYTIRSFDGVTLTLDFVDHGPLGPGSQWAGSALVGSTVRIFGPGEKKLADSRADWFFFGGDMSALPALSVNLETLASSAKGYAVIEIPDEKDKQRLAHPAGMQLIWVVEDVSQRPNKTLTTKIRSLDWLEGDPYPWFAGEFEGMRDMRSFFRDEKKIDRKNMYLSCYWKSGDSDEGMKKAKFLDAQKDRERLTMK